MAFTEEIEVARRAATEPRRLEIEVARRAATEPRRLEIEVARRAATEPRRLEIDLLGEEPAGEPLIDLTGLELAVLDQDLELRVHGAEVVEAPRRRWDSARIIDLCFGVPILMLALPVMAVLALAIRLDSNGPLLFRQERIGRDGQLFSCLKLRTMRPDAEERLRELLMSDPALEEEFLRTRKLADDPRVTRLGRIIRPLGLDELPQLWNVVRGDMSLVGPRPRAQSEFDICGDIPFGILGVRPGLTGPWQISGRNGITDEQRAAIELDYAANRTFLGDLKILIKTIALFASFQLRGGF